MGEEALALMILVTGCARSGTSLTAGVLRALGCELGPTNDLNENLAVRDGMVKPFIRSLGADPMCQDPLPTPDMVPSLSSAQITGWRHDVIAALGPLNGKRPAYKGAKMCHIWPIWADAFPDARWVIVRRDRDEIIDSCLRTSFMRAFDDRDGWGRWHDQHLERFEEMRRRLTCIEVWPGDEIKLPLPFFWMARCLALDYDVEAVRGVIKPSKWNAAA